MDDARTKLSSYLRAAQQHLSAALAFICERTEYPMLTGEGEKIVELLHELESLQERLSEPKRPATNAIDQREERPRRA